MRQKTKDIRQKTLTTNHRTPFTNRGYTLVELLAVTSIVVIVSGLIIGILYSTLRGSNKSKVTNDVAQNGNFALSSISNTALLATNVTKVNGLDINDCTASTENIAKFPDSTDGNPSGKSIEFEKADGTTISFSCDVASESMTSSVVSPTPSYLIDNNSVKVDPATCTFSCLQKDINPYSQPIISVSFTVSQRAGAVFENVASSTFSTSITMRNFSPK